MTTLLAQTGSVGHESRNTERTYPKLGHPSLIEVEVFGVVRPNLVAFEGRIVEIDFFVDFLIVVVEFFKIIIVSTGQRWKVFKAFIFGSATQFQFAIHSGLLCDNLVSASRIIIKQVSFSSIRYVGFIPIWNIQPRQSKADLIKKEWSRQPDSTFRPPARPRKPWHFFRDSRRRVFLI